MDIRMIKVRVRIFVEPDTQGFYAYCPELPGLHVDGETPEAAFMNASEAAKAYISSLIRHNDPLPVGSQDTTFGIGELIGKAISSWLGKLQSRTEEICVAT